MSGRAVRGRDDLLPPVATTALSSTGRALRRTRTDDVDDDELERARGAVRRVRGATVRSKLEQGQPRIVTLEELQERLAYLNEKLEAKEIAEDVYRSKVERARSDFELATRQKLLRELEGAAPAAADQEAAEVSAEIDKEARLLLSAREFLREERDDADPLRDNDVVRSCLRAAQMPADKCPAPFDFSNPAVALNPYLWVAAFELMRVEEEDLQPRFGSRSVRGRLQREWTTFVVDYLTVKVNEVESKPSAIAHAAIDRVGNSMLQLAKVWAMTDTSTTAALFLERWSTLMQQAEKDIRDVIYADLVARTRGEDEKEEYLAAIVMRDTPAFVSSALEVVRRRPIARAQTRRAGRSDGGERQSSGGRRRGNRGGRGAVAYDESKHSLVTDRVGTVYVHDKFSKKRLGRKA